MENRNTTISSVAKKDFFLEQYSTDAFTVSVDADIPEQLRTVFDFRMERQKHEAVSLQRSIIQSELYNLIDLGADYIDIGYHSDWVAVEFPITLNITHSMIDESGRILSLIRDKLSGKPPAKNQG